MSFLSAFMPEIIICPIVACLLFTLPTIILLPKADSIRFLKNKKPLQFGMLFAAIHFIFITLIAIGIHIGTQKDSELMDLWYFVLFLDMPISLLLQAVANFFAVPIFVFFLILGSAQYFLLGCVVGWLYSVVEWLY